MPKVTFSAELRAEYGRLFDTCQVRNSKLAQVEDTIAAIMRNRGRYESVAQDAGGGIPWLLIAVIHNLEASLNFTCHLHNGDPLTARTVQVPAGRPQVGAPPFTWEASAADALRYHNLDQWQDWSLPGILYKLEEYNGWGYRLYHPHVLSGYLWSCSNHYTSGKYIADGTWSDTAVSEQVGAAVVMRRMAERGITL